MLDRHYEFRDEMITTLEADLIGPAEGENELIGEAPLGRYIVGTLWPRPADDEPQAQEEIPEPAGAEANAEEEQEGSPVADARRRFPSSVGMTFAVRASTEKVLVIPRAARYEETVDTNDAVTGWQRVPLAEDVFEIDARSIGVRRLKLAKGLELYSLVRRPRDGAVTISVALNNVNKGIKGLKDAYSWFQTGIEVRTVGASIIGRGVARNIGSDSDLDTSALMYRNVHTFAIGHGCAAEWDLSAIDNGAVSRVNTTFIPTHEVHRAKPTAISGVDLRMHFLSEASLPDVTAALREMTRRYRQWIADTESAVASGDNAVVGDLVGVAERHMGDMRIAADRIDAGIDLLERDPEAERAFRLANRAMQLQRARQDWVRSGAQGEMGNGHDASWRPFQLAYILLNLSGITDSDHDDRELADLLWFPTGGGKTEAYLGLVAYVVLLRRIRDDAAFGVAVIMRYTLRLLTIQQFERATMLMCSLETVRKEVKELGDRPFSIGLWVGSGATPNDLRTAASSLKKLGRGEQLIRDNPVQLKQCPACGSELDHSHYKVIRSPEEHLRIACGQTNCDFGSGLPVYVVDQDVYRVRPELVLGTVDKFALMAWKSDVRKLFAVDGIGFPPELIIQDELHLISGPLGSMVGLYETAVDAACSVTTVASGLGRRRPKVIASTATIRRADAQIRAVFNRKAALFPPPGIDPDASFFAQPASRDELGTRRYVGVMAAGTSHATLMVRVYAALLQAAQDIEGDPDVRDPYWTLLGYFNSLRVLGSANLQVEGDVRERLAVVSKRNGRPTRDRIIVNELTSRVASSEIPENLKALERQVGDEAVDVVLATNMISVGVDIDRLGLMTVMGQPQASAEYIQSTSRVGRKHPGLVLTIFNSARSRDRSHYESFVPFHQALYRAVEATSATPFAARARDRGLHGVFVSLVRLLIPELSTNESAHLAEEHWDELAEIATIIEDRARGVDPTEEGATSDDLAELLRVWAEAGASRPNMKYTNMKNVEAALLVTPDVALIDESIEYATTDVPWPTLQSMRDVDAESGLYQIAMKVKQQS